MVSYFDKRNYSDEQMKCLELNKEQQKVFDTFVDAFNTFIKDAEALGMKFSLNPCYPEGYNLVSWCEKDFFTGASQYDSKKIFRSWQNPAQIGELPLSMPADMRSANSSCASFTLTPSLGRLVLLPREEVQFYYRVVPYVRTECHRNYRYDDKKGFDFKTVDEALQFLEVKQKESGESWKNSPEDIKFELTYKNHYAYSYFASKQEKLSEEGYIIFRAYAPVDSEES